MFIVVFTTARHLSVTWAKFIQSMPSRNISLNSILILFPSHAQVLLVPIFLQVSPSKPCTHLSSPACPIYLIILYFKSCIANYESAHYAIVSSLRSSLRPIMRDKISHPCNTTPKLQTPVF